jgi:hypothetical protein
MAAVTNNYDLKPQDGWVQVAAGGVTSFLRLNKFPHHVPVFLAFGSSAPSMNPVLATGTVTFSTGVPTAGQTVTIGSEVYTFVASGATGKQVNIGGTNLITATNFTAVVNAQSTLVSASDTAGVVTLTAIAAGPVGNYALATNGTNVAVSGAAMTGGALQNAGFRWECSDTWFEGAISNNVYARISNNSNADVRVSVFQN